MHDDNQILVPPSFIALYSDTALATSPIGTSSLTNGRRTGLSTASDRPPMKATT